MPTKATAQSLNGERTDAGLLEELVRRYSGALRRYFARSVEPAADADDLVQEVFMRLARRSEVDSIEEVERYLFRSAANILRDRARRSAVRYEAMHQPYNDEDHGQASEISPERVLIGRNEIEQVETALLDLPERTRDVFVLRFLEELSVREISRMLSVSTRSVDYHIAKALDHLVKALG